MVWRLAEQHVQGVGGGEGKDLEHHIVLEGVEIMIWRPGAEASILERLGAEASISTVTGTQGGEVLEIMRLRGVTGRQGGVADIKKLVEARADIRKLLEARAVTRNLMEAEAVIGILV